jgi:Fanconi-associated nuclease 1
MKIDALFLRVKERASQGILVPHSPATNYNEDLSRRTESPTRETDSNPVLQETPDRPIKRLRRLESAESVSSAVSDVGSIGSNTVETQYSPSEKGEYDDDENLYSLPGIASGQISSQVSPNRQHTNDTLEEDRAGPAPPESAFPDISTDEQAIEDYEASRHDELSSQLSQSSATEQKLSGTHKSSIYVDAFNLALNTVIDEEPHLFSTRERAVFAAWRKLDYEAQYLYVRLFLRKTNLWHRIQRLGYYGDIGDMAACVSRLQIWEDLPEEKEEDKISSGFEPPPETILESRFRFADCSDEDLDNLNDASALLSLDELKSLARDAKVQGKNKSDLLSAFRRTSRHQTGLNWSGKTLLRSESSGSLNADEEGSPYSDGAVTPPANREALFREKILALTGPCIRLSRVTTALFERVHLVFFRSTEWSEKSLIVTILSRIQRRVFYPYLVYRCNNIFSRRADLLEFEYSLRLQAMVDDLLENTPRPSQQTFQSVIDIFEEIEPRWESIIATEEEKERNGIYDLGEGTYMRRFNAGWVYTRIAHKAVSCIARIHQYEREHSLLTRLLKQQMFHPARRGAWYSRRALIEERYLEGAKERKGFERALQTCESGLRDRNTHVIFHDEIQRRIVKLERRLRYAFAKRSIFSHVALIKPTETTIYGLQIIPLDGAGSSTRTAWKTCESDEEIITVEEMALSHYVDHHSFNGRHTESRVMGYLFASLLYEVVFMPLPGLFQTPYQSGPLDFGTDTFYTSRLSEIESLLDRIEGDHPTVALKLLDDLWTEHWETKSTIRGLDWALFTRLEIEEVIRAWRGTALVAVLRALAQAGGATGGVPDLFLWRPAFKEKEQEAEVRFVEVKSKNDRLSETQKMWIHVLSTAGVAVEVAHVLNKE